MPPEFFADWRCECGDLNRDHEAFCFRCGAGRDADEPPTEAANASERDSWRRVAERLEREKVALRTAMRAAMEATGTSTLHYHILRDALAVEPPTETPKACPTCGGEGLAIVKRGAVQEYCDDCLGSGIDGGTPCE